MRLGRRRLLGRFFRERLGPQISTLTLHRSRAVTSHPDLFSPQREPGTVGSADRRPHTGGTVRPGRGGEKVFKNYAV